jgi:hypothetical protein
MPGDADTVVFTGVLRDKVTSDTVAFVITYNYVHETMRIATASDTMNFRTVSFDSCCLLGDGVAASVQYHYAKAVYYAKYRTVLRLYGGVLRLALLFVEEDAIGDEWLGVNDPDSPAWNGDGSSNDGGVSSTVIISEDGERIRIEQNALRYTLHGRTVDTTRLHGVADLEYDERVGCYVNRNNAETGPRRGVERCSFCASANRVDADDVTFVRFPTATYAFDGRHWFVEMEEGCYCREGRGP